jgi:hypothetical protein
MRVESHEIIVVPKKFRNLEFLFSELFCLKCESRKALLFVKLVYHFKSVLREAVNKRKIVI